MSMHSRSRFGLSVLRRCFAGVGATLLLLTPGLAAAEPAKVLITETHICCPACEKAITTALQREGVSQLTVDQENVTVSFTAAEPAVATEALKAFVGAGFFGKVTINGAPTALKAPSIPTGKAGRLMKISGTHLCCSQCVEDARKLLFAIPNVDEVNANQFTRMLYVLGNGVDSKEVITRLRAAGFACDLMEIE